MSWTSAGGRAEEKYGALSLELTGLDERRDVVSEAEEVISDNSPVECMALAFTEIEKKILKTQSHLEKSTHIQFGTY